ncbi:cyclin-I isoform X1 [Rana temporaria]|uniref:cyclin-I isoform X1 n=1 Tax=Rana temporaria TaxID=8407 RepID=UPI001AADF557|nr:cyclin-I isoform X1 [Rana temporaria]
MKYSGPLESQRLSFLLERAVSREAQMWKVCVHKTPTNQDTAISPQQRDDVIQWLAELRHQFQVYPETLALAINILDRFLASVKAHPKYLRCIAISCFFLATKTIEEDEQIPVLKVLTQESDCGCSPAEVLRMERIILDKLNWDLHTATPLDFLQIFHAMALTSSPQMLDRMPEMNPSQHLALLTRQLLQCVASHQLLQFKGSMLALAVLSLNMEKLLPDWLGLTIKLLQTAEMDSSQLFRCREEAARHLSPLQASLPTNAVYVYSPFKQTLVTCNRGEYQFRPSPVPGPAVHKQGKSTPGALMKGATFFYQRLAAPTACKQASTKRKVEQMEVDDFYDGIKRLYNEDTTMEVGSIEIAACNSSLSRQEGSISPCPQLQAVSVM